ncbi:hypothetical protein GIB67_011991 [Kingdonia uniflora]|uniref:Uncharacterized protein n=1 Tax=Kingdonia uniflora TaxID=39325 RepID=A0A7J7LZZ3_9MAGN|nr:hypothetical protein GIB67_011991 [Kingdonia uniflora]
MLQNLHRVLSRIPSYSVNTRALSFGYQAFSTKSGNGKGKDTWDEGWGSVKKNGNTQPEFPSDFGFDSLSSWSTGLTKDHFDGEAVGHQVTPTPTSSTGAPKETVSVSQSKASTSMVNEDVVDTKKGRHRVEKSSGSWADKLTEVNESEEFKELSELNELMQQIREPGARGSYLKDSEKAEMYKLHKENPEVYTVEKLAKDYRIIRQRVHAILWLKEIEEEEEKKCGPLDDSIERLLDTCPEFFDSHDREFHVASLPYKPDFKVMPEGWDGTTKDPDEVHYEISVREDEMLYQDFVRRMTFNKKQMAGEVIVHKHSRRRDSEGWNFTVEKLGLRGKRGNAGGHKFVSLPNGSSRPLNEMEKLYLKRETVRRRRKIL